MAVTMTEFQFHPDPIQSAPGRATFAVTNVGTVAHDFTLLTAGGHARIAHTAPVAPGATVRVTLTLAAGSYPVVCTQPGHQEAGMESRLEVR
ncbi:MAG TPA: plastocyanin/azurin family copper-binding protein [Candidatus Acidoferrales bacterium]|nr:plastocyanin/azurin family copper-binding protein [Candidatus Acidoferrales bacterium]